MGELAVHGDAKRTIGRAGAALSMISKGLGAPFRTLSGRPIVSTAVAAVLLGGFGLAAGAAGYWASERDIPEKIATRYVEPMMSSTAERLGLAADLIEPTVRTISTNGHLLEISQTRILSGGQPMPWALAEAGDNILFASRYGQLHYLNGDNRISSLELNTPQRFDRLDASGHLDDPVFEVAEVRTFDLMTVRTGEGAYDLYASYARYKDECFEIAVSRTPLELTDDGVRATTGRWEDVYVVNPCIAIKFSGMRFAGHEAGGRLAMLDEDTLLLSVGVLQLDNVAEGQLAGQDPATDIGKIIEIKLSTGEARIYARGFRNPQGLLVASDGRVWETEHGPQGGDEVNVIVDGGNYGWPLATYGMDYSNIPKDWPFTDTPGRQDGYVAPVFSFTPSIGISNIIQPDPQAFPRWKDQFVVASLSAASLFVLRVIDDRVVTAEPIPFGERLRDIIQLSDGRIAISSDAGDLFIVRNAELPKTDDAEMVVSGLTALAAPLEEAGLQDGSPLQQGARAFFYSCGACHSVNGEPGIGPPLNGVIGRRVGSFEGYGYSPALKEHGGVWSRGMIESFVLDTQGTIPGSMMPTLAPPDLPLMTRYLASTKATPPEGR